MSVRVVDRMPQFKRNAKSVMNDALREASRDILVLSRNKAPYQKGGLRTDADAKMVKQLHWKVSYYKEYARFQEFGGDSKRRVRNYTTPGTGKKYLSNSGKRVGEKITTLFKKHGGRAK